MKISLNWLKKYVDIKVPNEDLIRLIGARLVEVEGVIDETYKYDKIYVARVETAEKIEGTHLTLCKINVGEAGKELAKVEADENGLVQVMWGLEPRAAIEPSPLCQILSAISPTEPSFFSFMTVSFPS